MFCVLTNIEFLTEIFNNFLWNLSFINFQKLNVLTAIKFDFKHTNWLIIFLSRWRQSVLGFNLWSSSLIGTSISSGWSRLSLELILWESVSRNTLRSLSKSRFSLRIHLSWWLSSLLISWWWLAISIIWSLLNWHILDWSFSK